MTESDTNWSEENSRFFLQYAQYFVPDRETQIRTLCSLVPDPGQPFRILELACGAGLLAGALLERFPNSTVHGFDGSHEMLQTARQHLHPFGDRFLPGKFDLASREWRKTEPFYQVVVSSLAIHHLDNAGKAALFRDVFTMLFPGGAFLVADIIWPSGPQSQNYAAEMYDEAVRRRAEEIDGNLSAFDRFRSEQWNIFRYPDDPIDQPSTLFDQLKWLEAAGFQQVDVCWLRAGHAIFAGYKEGNFPQPQ
ncbi:MAG: class I SAM-dependent methyltransferase [Chloroflexi bacterium]|nr:MAG: class I SAM-dependent methyltransferase [Chloroflexota bacterium]